MEDETLGIKGIPTGNLSANVGFIIIPKELDIDEYKADVYRSGRVSIYGGLGYGDFHNISVDREVLQRIKFPERAGSYGSPVVWINIPKHNEPVVIACLKYDDEFHILSEQRFSVTRGMNGGLVDLDLDGKNSKIRIGVSSTSPDKEAILEINLTSKNDNSKFRININGEVIMNASGRIIHISEDKIETVVSDKTGKNVARMIMNSDQDTEGAKRFLYEDEYKNAVYVTKDSIQIKADDSKLIKFGEGEEPIVKGTTLKAHMDELIAAISTLTVSTAFGSSGTPINTPQFTSIQAKFEMFLSKLVKSD